LLRICLTSRRRVGAGDLSPEPYLLRVVEAEDLDLVAPCEW
jgi:hypothetical protein